MARQDALHENREEWKGKYMSEENDWKSRVLPRVDLRESAFRKYEHYIAMACQGSYELDVRKEMKNTARTFMVRFADAKRGFKLFGYLSSKIPHGYELRNITVKELEGDKVMVVNEVADAESKRKRKEQEKVKQAKMWLSADGMTLMVRQKEQPKRVFRYSVDNPEMVEMFKYLQDKVLNGREHALVAIRVTSEEERLMLEEVKKTFPNVYLEDQEFEGWWRALSDHWHIDHYGEEETEVDRIRLRNKLLGEAEKKS